MKMGTQQVEVFFNLSSDVDYVVKCVTKVLRRNTYHSLADRLEDSNSSEHVELKRCLLGKDNEPLTREIVKTICKTLTDSFCGDEEFIPDEFIKQLTGKSPLNTLLTERLGHNAKVLKILGNAIQINFRNRGNSHDISYYTECIRNGGTYRVFVRDTQDILDDLQ